MDPVTMTAVSMGLSAAGGLLGMQGAQQEGQAQAQMYNFQAGQALYNAKVARENRDWALAEGEGEAIRYGLKSAQQRGAITAAKAASGIDITSGSAQDVIKSQKFVSDMDMEMIRKNAARKAYAYETQAVSEEKQAELYRMAGSNAKTAAKYKGMASLISGASSVSSKWMDANRVGIF